MPIVVVSLEREVDSLRALPEFDDLRKFNGGAVTKAEKSVQVESSAWNTHCGQEGRLLNEEGVSGAGIEAVEREPAGFQRFSLEGLSQGLHSNANTASS